MKHAASSLQRQNANVSFICKMPIYGFAPIEQENARILVLGSMPGDASLRADQYYAHPRNQFWSILGNLLNIAPQAAYELRIAALKSAKIALWDVCCSCNRVGSLDANIEPRTLVPNDFATFFQNHPDISQIFFNGAKALECYRKYVPQTGKSIPYLLLPSTSPANAAVSAVRKLEAWRVISAHIV